MRRLLGRGREYRAILSEVHNRISDDYGDIIDLTYTDTLLCGFGKVKDSVCDGFPIVSRIGLAGLFSDFDKGKLCRFANDGLLVKAVVSSFHECRHAIKLSEMLSGNLSDAKYFEVAHLAGYGNDMYVTRNWSKFLTEVDAEQYGIQEAGLLLSNYFGDEKASDLLLQYVNNRVRESDYFVSFPVGKSEFCDMNDVFGAFDESYERAKHAHREYVLPKCQDVFQNFMYGEMSDETRAKFFAEQDGFQQDKMVAAVTLYHHPEYQSQYPVLRECDMSMEAIFGPTWSKSEASLEPLLDVKSGTKVNRGIRHPRLNQKACGVELRELDMTHDGEDECEY